MIDFVKGLIIAIKESFKSKKTINYPFEKGKISPRFSGGFIIGSKNTLRAWTT